MNNRARNVESKVQRRAPMAMIGVAGGMRAAQRGKPTIPPAREENGRVVMGAGMSQHEVQTGRQGRIVTYRKNLGEEKGTGPGLMMTGT